MPPAAMKLPVLLYDEHTHQRGKPITTTPILCPWETIRGGFLEPCDQVAVGVLNIPTCASHGEPCPSKDSCLCRTELVPACVHHMRKDYAVPLHQFTAKPPVFFDPAEITAVITDKVGPGSVEPFYLLSESANATIEAFMAVAMQSGLVFPALTRLATLFYELRYKLMDYEATAYDDEFCPVEEGGVQ